MIWDLSRKCIYCPGNVGRKVHSDIPSLWILSTWTDRTLRRLLFYTLFYVMLYYIILCCIISYYIVLYYVIYVDWPHATVHVQTKNL